ncbi:MULTISPECIES: catabolite repressor/activator [Vibrio]|jgi:LacI family fructose operon transcriptional repressor|uniref:Autoinducer 2-binding periplasmic protein LuxP n=1 Tax=Vibrio natriegens NBRC 15636 = ATCC 14048 = DSM 759 TaxID=1219067 RepID=A0AAN0Y5D6_VIBNA|nr:MULTISPECIES: catabolite repressor/activator [Vibrio]MEE3876845.1 catabolite repressor/activator [Vibrio sp. YYF0003]AEX24448.1 DNA-binding transcriptional regulator FruR [Vibrio sp. EJY3]ALR18390.1 transcriptional regulator [Vibrio natriegens NBRC 15636 = ATCC 14048 = DSM 759]ANQ14337.1 DNA-binding transcriptional regulator FruR [Vibrio natriegens NBRC 15636 = ATCC 14048 = DSM 759]AXT72537.1 catabolite repressor/activator [Vibrio sp. dhg]
MTLDEIAKLAGVSKTTASYVINGKAQKYRISEKTQKRVMAVVDEHNYKPDHAASALRAGNSRSFGLIIPDLENTSYARLAKLIEQNSRKAGYQILIGCSDDDPETEQKVAEALISRRIDALFVASGMPNANEFYLKLQNSGTPVIALDRPMDDEHFCCILSEDFDAALELTESVLSNEINSVGLIGALPDLQISKERELGFRSACQQGNKTVQVGYGQQFSREEGKKVLEKWLADDHLPDAIVTTSYTLLEGVLDMMLEQPDLMSKVRLATFGDNRLLDFLSVKINSLPQQFEVIADSAMELALNASAKRYKPGVELIPRKIVKRQ